MTSTLLTPTKMPPLSETARQLIQLALAEDLPQGDRTSMALLSPDETCMAKMKARHPFVLSGLDVVRAVYAQLDPRVVVETDKLDGDAVIRDEVILTLHGPKASILAGERVALNFLQQLSGIATLTYQYVGAIFGTGCQITHTRKTPPGLRDLAIAAVGHGGGVVNRRHLSERVMIKDNHIQAVGSLSEAINRIRQQYGPEEPITVECDTAEQVDEALRLSVDRILLDNMTPAQLKPLVAKIGKKAISEASGGITLKTVVEVAKTGVNLISTGAITMHAPSVDIGLDF